MNKIIKKFIELTDYTYIYGDEDKLEKHLPKNILTDSVGNYYIKIGESDTMFCSHLDTAAYEKEKVEHDFWKSEGKLFVGTKGDIIKKTYKNKKGETIEYDAKTGTLLGADDKAGVVIMLNMIENNIPGLYYFFIGEEVGRIGSTAAYKNHNNIFKEYKRCISFDRRGYGSIISKQMGSVCCSSEFVSELSKEFKKVGMVFKDDPTGIYTDSATFMDVIPECTNLSVGYFDEHTEYETQDLTYLVKLSNACLKINWDSLPVKRNPMPFKTPDPKRSPKKLGDLSDDELWDIFIDVDDILETKANVYCKNYSYFIPEKEMIYVSWYDDNDIVSVWVHEDGSITVGKQKFTSYYELKEELSNYYDDEDDEDDEDIYDSQYDQDINDGNEIKDDFNKMVNDFEDGLNLQEFLFDVVNFTDSKNKNRISAVEMKNILDKYDKPIENFIYWLYSKNNDPDKTYGIKWDDNRDNFLVQE